MLEFRESFEHDYEIELPAELPGSSDSMQHCFYPGAAEQGGESIGLLLKILPCNGNPWMASFAKGPGGFSGVLSHPDSRRVCVVCFGTGYVLRVDDPAEWYGIECYPIRDVQSIPNHGLLVFASFTDLCAYGCCGKSWQTDRLVTDDLVITDASSDTITGCGSHYERDTEARFAVDITTGRHIVEYRSTSVK